MSYQRFLTVNFGATQTGLTTVGYQLFNTDKSSAGTRVAVGASAECGSGSGIYGALVTIPDGQRGYILWDTGTTPNKYASASINPEASENEDSKISTVSTAITQIKGDGWASTDTLTSIRSAIDSPTIGSGSIEFTHTVLGSDGNPVAGAYVSFYTDSSRTGTPYVSGLTDYEGKIRVLVPAGTYYLKIITNGRLITFDTEEVS